MSTYKVLQNLSHRHTGEVFHLPPPARGRFGEVIPVTVTDERADYPIPEGRDWEYGWYETQNGKATGRGFLSHLLEHEIDILIQVGAIEPMDEPEPAKPTRKKKPQQESEAE